MNLARQFLNIRLVQPSKLVFKEDRVAFSPASGLSLFTYLTVHDNCAVSLFVVTKSH